MGIIYQLNFQFSHLYVLTEKIQPPDIQNMIVLIFGMQQKWISFVLLRVIQIMATKIWITKVLPPIGTQHFPNMLRFHGIKLAIMKKMWMKIINESK